MRWCAFPTVLGTALVAMWIKEDSGRGAASGGEDAKY
jgi:hypothetical protein